MTGEIIPQPVLPEEVAITDSEWNFIYDSPRGFFPENQDSNWGYKRKIYSDQVHLAVEQLALIFAEIFPQSSQEFLDEWEEEVGLPQNPPNVTLENRRRRVINRLRGGPFTRAQRREIVESYITATFGDPIILLPPGHGLEVAGSPLFNEPGDVFTLYSILEYVTSFSYEVRIQSGLAIDQLGLERDLKWFTPAGINIIFNYAWVGKFATDFGAGGDVGGFSDSLGNRVIGVVDVGHSAEGVAYKVVDTGAGVDIGKLILPVFDVNVNVPPTYFPSMPILDNFNRANEGPPMTGWANWGVTGLKVLSNQLAPDGIDWRGGYWNTEMPRDVEAYIEISTETPASGITYLAARLDPLGGGFWGDFYSVEVGEYAPDTLVLRRYDDSTPTDLGTASQEFAPGDAIGIRCVGNTIEAWARISGVWSKKITVTDTGNDGLGTRNKIGLITYNPGAANARYDNFGGGPVSTENLSRKIEVFDEGNATMVPTIFPSP